MKEKTDNYIFVFKAIFFTLILMLSYKIFTTWNVILVVITIFFGIIGATMLIDLRRDKNK